MIRFAVAGVLCVLMTACASSAPDAVLQVGSRSLRCPHGDVSIALNRSTPEVNEYLVGCDFMYTRVHCRDAGCRPAEVKPPCIGEGPCFEEDPITLEWRLPAALAHRSNR